MSSAASANDPSAAAQQKQQQEQPLSRKEKLEHYLAKNAAVQHRKSRISIPGATAAAHNDEAITGMKQPLRTSIGSASVGSVEKPKSAKAREEEYSNYLERLAKYQQRKSLLSAGGEVARNRVGGATAAVEPSSTIAQEKENDSRQNGYSAAKPSAPSATAASTVVGSTTKQGVTAVNLPPTSSTNRSQSLDKVAHPSIPPVAPSHTISPATIAGATRMATPSRSSSLLRPTASSYGKQRRETPARLKVEANSNVNPMIGSSRPSARAQSPMVQQRRNSPPATSGFAGVITTPATARAGVGSGARVGGEDEAKGNAELLTTPATAENGAETGLSTTAAGMRRATPCRAGFPGYEGTGVRTAPCIQRYERSLPATAQPPTREDETVEKTPTTSSRLKAPRAVASPARALTTTPTPLFHQSRPSKEAVRSAVPAGHVTPPEPSAPSTREAIAIDDVDGTFKSSIQSAQSIGSLQRYVALDGEDCGKSSATNTGNDLIDSQKTITTSASRNSEGAETVAEVAPCTTTAAAVPAPPTAVARLDGERNMALEHSSRKNIDALRTRRSSIDTKSGGIKRPPVGGNRGAPETAVVESAAASTVADASATLSSGETLEGNVAIQNGLNPGSVEMKAVEAKATSALQVDRTDDEKRCTTPRARRSASGLTPPRYSWQSRHSSLSPEQAASRKRFGRPAGAVGSSGTSISGTGSTPFREDSTEPNRVKTDESSGKSAVGKRQEMSMSKPSTTVRSPPLVRRKVSATGDSGAGARRKSFGFSSPPRISARRMSAAAITTSRDAFVVGNIATADANEGAQEQRLPEAKAPPAAGAPKGRLRSGSEGLGSGQLSTTESYNGVEDSEEKRASRLRERFPLREQSSSEGSPMVGESKDETNSLPSALVERGDQRDLPRVIDKERTVRSLQPCETIAAVSLREPPTSPSQKPPISMSHCSQATEFNSCSDETSPPGDRGSQASAEVSMQFPQGIFPGQSVEEECRRHSGAFVQGRDRRRGRKHVNTTGDVETIKIGRAAGALNGTVLASPMKESVVSSGIKEIGRQDGISSVATIAGESDEDESARESGSEYETGTDSGSESEEDGSVGEDKDWRSSGLERRRWDESDYMDDGNEDSAFAGGIVLDPDLPLSSNSSDTASLHSTPSTRLSNGEVRPSIARTSLPMPPSAVRALGKVETAEMETQTVGGCGSGMANASVQAGSGRLLTQQELEDETTLQEMRRLRMSAEDLLIEVFHREVVIQEQAQLRRKLTESYEDQVAQLQQRLYEQEMNHKNEKIKMRWDHSNQLEMCSGSANGQTEEALSEARASEQDAYREVEELKRSHTQQQLTLQETRKTLTQLRKKYEEQGATLQKTIRSKEAAQKALKQMMDEIEAQEEDEDEDEEREGFTVTT